jgi:integrase
VKRRELVDGKVVFEACFNWQDPMSGKPKQRSTRFDKKRDAAKQLAAWQHEFDRGAWVEKSEQTVGELLLYWLDTHARNRVRESTYVSYKHIVMNHLIPGLGHITAQKLTPAQVQTFYAAKQDAGASVRTVRFCHLHLGQALELAVKQGTLARKVTDAVTPPSQQRKEMEIWSAAEAQRFLAVADESTYGPIWLVIAGAGLRRGEALGLRWKDIDWERGIIQVRQQVQAPEGKPKIVPYTKDGRGGKSVAVPPSVLESLRSHRARQAEARLKKGAEWQDHGLVFPSAVGTPVSPRNLSREFYALREKAGVPPIRIHDIRHTVATHLIEAGVDVKAVSEHLGHKGVEITRAVYQHVTERQRRGVADAIGSIILGQGGQTAERA